MNKIRVLFVDDDERLLNSLMMTYRQEFDVVCCNSAESAIEQMEQQPFDVLVCDERMPKTRGLKFLAVARQRWPGTARILLAGHLDEQSANEDMLQAGLFCFIRKPWKMEDLSQAILDASVQIEEYVEPIEPVGPSRPGDIDPMHASNTVVTGATRDAEEDVHGLSLNTAGVFVSGIGDEQKMVQRLQGLLIPELMFESTSNMLFEVKMLPPNTIVLVDLASVTMAVGHWVKVMQSRHPEISLLLLGSTDDEYIASKLENCTNVVGHVTDDMGQSQVQAVVDAGMKAHLNRQ